jgi:large subunit ribosomal protein L30
VARIEVTQVKSTIGTKPVHRATMKALGLGGIGRVTILADSPDVRGMLHKVTHLISVQAAAEPAAADGEPVTEEHA